jgi:hypothetical protein
MIPETSVSPSSLCFYGEWGYPPVLFLWIKFIHDLRDDLLELRRYEKIVFLAGDINVVEKMTFYLSKTIVNFDEWMALKSSTM